ncbi:MAG: hypothetical protein AAF291_08980 [Pseudomonadota bacterium]
MAMGLAVNLLVLARGVVLMLVLGYAELGFVALVQAAITFVGMLHFGMLNGGYRLLCHAGPRTRQRIVDFAYTGFGALGALLAIAALLAGAVSGDPVTQQVAAFTVVGGVATLMRSWVMNEMVAGQRLRSANVINAASMLASLAVLALLFAPTPPFTSAIIAVSAIVTQPVLFVALALISGAVLRPKAWRASGRLGAIVVKTGFVMFVAGLALQFLPLIERTYVSNELGLEALGRLYLAILFVTLFQMAPNLIQQVFLAPVVELWRKKDAEAIRFELRALLTVMILYCAASAGALWLLAEPVVALVLPGYVDDLRWVYLVAPGLIAFALCVPFSLSFNVVIDYSWYLIAYLSGVAVTLAIFGASAAMGTALNLDQVTMVRSGVFALMGAVLLLGSWRINQRAPEFRLFGRVTPMQ